MADVNLPAKVTITQNYQPTQQLKPSEQVTRVPPIANIERARLPAKRAQDDLPILVLKERLKDHVPPPSIMQITISSRLNAQAQELSETQQNEGHQQEKTGPENRANRR